MFKISGVDLFRWVLIAALVSFFIADIANTYLYFATSVFQKISIIPRSIFEVIIVGYLLFQKRFSKISLYLLIITISLFGMFLIGFGTYSSRNIDASWVVAVQHFNKHIYILLCFLFVWDIWRKSGRTGFNKVFKAYEIIIYLNAVAIIGGMLFDIHWLSSYGFLEGFEYRQYRWGYKGLIPAVNEASLFWIVALFYGLLVYKNEGKVFLLILSIICCCLIGSKGAFLFGIFSVFLFGTVFKRKNCFIILSMLILCFLIVLPFVYKELLLFFKGLKILAFYFAYSERGANFMSILLTGRDTFVSRAVENVLYYWNVFNYLFGGQDRMKYLVEMDVFDTPLFFGIIGTGVYFASFMIMFNKIQSGFKLIFTIVYFGMAFFGGHVFWSAVNSMYLTLFIVKADSLGSAVPGNIVIE